MRSFIIGLLITSVLLLQPHPVHAISIQLSPAKRLSVSGGRFSPEINWSRRAPKTTGCLAPYVETREINDNVRNLKNSGIPKLMKGVLKKFFSKRSQTPSLNRQWIEKNQEDGSCNVKSGCNPNLPY
jgi:hypothetical protein